MNDPTLPTFIIGGAPRSGTTYLGETLSRHPEVAMALPLVPEPKVFVVPPHTDETYRQRYRAFFGNAGNARARGEKTTHYLENPEMRFAIQRVVPNVRLIFIVREPVARAYSNYLKTKKGGLEDLSFEEAIRLEGKRPCPLPPEKAYARPHAYLSRGDYGTFLEPYFETFGRERVHVCLYEDISRRRDTFLREIQEFIGVTPLPGARLCPGVVNSAKEMGPPIDSATELELRERMQPCVARFASVTGMDITPWGYAA